MTAPERELAGPRAGPQPLTLVAGYSHETVFRSSATMSCISTSALWLPDSFCSTDRPLSPARVGGRLPPRGPTHLAGRAGSSASSPRQSQGCPARGAPSSWGGMAVPSSPLCGTPFLGPQDEHAQTVQTMEGTVSLKQIRSLEDPEGHTGMWGDHGLRGFPSNSTLAQKVTPPGGHRTPPPRNTPGLLLCPGGTRLYRKGQPGRCKVPRGLGGIKQATLKCLC